MREEEKIMAGILFCPSDPELRAIKLKSHNLNLDFNRLYEINFNFTVQDSMRCKPDSFADNQVTADGNE